LDEATATPATRISVEYSLSSRERVAATLRVRFVQFSFLLLLVVSPLSGGYWGLVTGFLLVGFLVGLLWLVTLLTARRTRAHAYPARLEVDEGGVSIQQPTSSVHLEWAFVSRVRKSGPYFILSRSFVVGIPIPRRSFGEPGSEETFRALCRAHTRTNF
jgi:YcxB-like protein